MKTNKQLIIALLPLLLFAAIGWLFWKGLHNDPSVLPSALLNKPVPGFKFETLDNNGKYLSHKDFKGKISVLNIWATWCPNCELEHEMMSEVAKEQGVTLYGINYKDDRTKAQQWLAKLGNPYEAVAYDPTGKLAIDFGVYGAPETFLIDANGIVRYKLVGPMSPQVWQDELRPKIAELRQEMS